ncbi:MAG: hypothetical protein CMM52_04990 [Rhodospirillaceae bacterium]|nr:hypothetical protein [Rhodospirillaceae bacterium]|tara:strand:- start:5089 stop:5847 length:759 start_codon:yes stop_codon:yes gene_type:complete
MDRKTQIESLLKSIETGDPEPIAVVNQDKYIQHNPQTHEGSEGLEELFKRLSKTLPRVNIVRAFEDGDYVFAHTEYNFANSNIGFEVFRFEGDQVVEHWDNIQRRQERNGSDTAMIDGPTEAKDQALTEDNRHIVNDLVREVFVGRELAKLGDYVDDLRFKQHSPRIGDGLSALCSVLEEKSGAGFTIQYEHVHRILCEGDSALSVCEGNLSGEHSSFYDLFRLQDGKIVEHWETTEAIPPRSAWKNDNGKF